MYHQPQIETMPRAELADLQLSRMKETVRRCYEAVPFYRASFDAAGIEPGDLETIGDLTKFPFVTKQDMRDNYPFGLFAVPRDEVARIHASSGTTGQATVVGSTKNDLENWADCFARGVMMCGADPSWSIQIAYGYGLFTGGLGAHAGSERAGLGVIPISSGNTRRQISVMRDFAPELLACTPSYALLIADTLEEMGVDPATELNLKAGIFGAEPAGEQIRREVAERLGIVYHDIYGLSEVMGPGVACECDFGGGLHLAEDHFYAEVVDPETLEPVAPGEMGELVITTLTREACPLVRYRTRDLTRIVEEPCACGRTHRKIGRILGRSDDMLIIRGVNVFPQQIEELVTAHPEVSPHYQIVLRREGRLDTAELRIEPASDFVFDEVAALERLERKLEAELKAVLQVSVKVRICEPKTIERSEGKAKRVLDLR